ncbi:MAG: NADH-dependent phenylglyoxylate dehydrogenase subunit gamma [Syntrophomonadaceae bacterium]|nr:NADH-dependent phenylglyoxylate dehydrogenase subunit gamma [Bacillota bacterium]MBT9137575.1 NADH-dependent phenylglyoxylate dehydrogenase subunit gamma [Bacillota bacterium]
MKSSIRMSGLGGQGMVTAANLLGTAAVKDGKYSIVIPFFGAEKRLAPTESYLRISDEEVYEKGEAVYPNIIMVFHKDVIDKGKCYTMPFYEGLQSEGLLIINSANKVLIPEYDISKLRELKINIIYVSASKIAMEVAGTELATNMVMLGALIGVTEIVTLESMEKAITERFSGKTKFIASGTTAALDDVLKKKYTKAAQLIEKNMEAIRVAYTSTKKA